VPRLFLAVAVLAALVAPGAAPAKLVVLRDGAGRPIRLDVRAPDVDASWYAGLLRGAAHGAEIGRVTVRIVTWDRINSLCGKGAAACYRGRRGATALIVVPAGKGTTVAHALFHEYGHHVDASLAVPDVREPNGTAAWWQARDLSALVAQDEVAASYRLGWQRSIGEIFAEDYAQLHLRDEFGIDWLTAPDATVLDALRADVPNAPAEPLDLTGTPVVEIRSGTLRRGTSFSVPFELRGPGRRVTFIARVAQVHRRGVRAQLRLRCGRITFTRGVASGRAVVRIDRRHLGPGVCTVGLRGTAATPLAFTATLRLAVEPAPPAQA
jgi:hypothetical protein